MARRILAFLLTAAMLLWGAEIRLYLKEGGYHVVREYKVLEDRVRYYSSERGDWEEIPLELVDLKRTERELANKQEAERKQAVLDDEEEKFERAQAAEIARIPQDPGVYLAQTGDVLALKRAELKVVTNKGRSILKAITPIPVVTGKALVEMDGERSAVVVRGDRPTFYLRTDMADRFGLVRCEVRKNARLLERWEIAPVVNIVQATRNEIELFRQEMHPGLYKIWPQKPIEPGEYAVIQYTEGEGNTQAWDFRLEKEAR